MTKIFFGYTILFVLVVSCSQNDLSETELVLTTDKEVYLSDDQFELTIMIKPLKSEKKIRILKNLNNLKISFFIKDHSSEFSQELKKHFLENPSLFSNYSDYSQEYRISNSKPYIKVVKGKIAEEDNIVIIEIPELNLKKRFYKSDLLIHPEVTIKGHYYSIYSGVENYFTPKNIRVIMQQKKLP